MKFLLCGCFHGRVPSKFFSIIKKEKPDLIIFSGDFQDSKYLTKWEFKHGDKIMELLLGGKDWKEIINKTIGMKRYLNYEKKDLVTTKNVLKKLKKIKTKFYYTYGNHDGSEENIKLLNNFSKGNFKFIPRGKIIFKDYKLIFYGGHRGTSGKPYLVNWKKASKEHKKFVKKRISMITNNLRRWFNKKDKNIIFITHDPPYKTKLDILNPKYSESGKLKKGVHIGDDIYRKFDKIYQPLVHVCSHMHENPGYDKIGKTLIINSGPAFEGKFALLELKKDKIKKLKFYK